MKKILLLSLACLLFATAAFAQDGTGQVARASFATGVENREPVEIITEYVPVEGGAVYYFTELRNLAGSRVSHVWHRNGEEIYSLSFNVGGDRWRTNSRMQAANFKSGDTVTVEVMGEDGTVYESTSLMIR